MFDGYFVLIEVLLGSSESLYCGRTCPEGYVSQIMIHGTRIRYMGMVDYAVNMASPFLRAL